jgi:predicted fused transcriptional regulator/phosphomethylpyrimidine kinase
MMGFLYDDIADACRAEAGSLATVYWLLFFLVIAVLLMNMILAIIFDVYTEVKNDAGDAAYLWTQVIEAIEYQKNRLELLKQAAHYVHEMGAELAGIETEEHKSLHGQKPLNRTWVYRQLNENDSHPDDIMTPGSMGKEWKNKFTLASSTLLLKDVEEYVRHLRVKADVDVDDVMRVLGRMDMNIRDMMARARFEFGDPMLVNRKTQQFEAEIDFVLRKLGADPDEIAMNAGLVHKHPKTLAQLDEQMHVMGLMAAEYQPTAEEIAKMGDAAHAMQGAVLRNRPGAASSQLGPQKPTLLPGARNSNLPVGPRHIPKGAKDSYRKS